MTTWRIVARSLVRSVSRHVIAFLCKGKRSTTCSVWGAPCRTASSLGETTIPRDDLHLRVVANPGSSCFLFAISQERYKPMRFSIHQDRALSTPCASRQNHPHPPPGESLQHGEHGAEESAAKSCDGPEAASVQQDVHQVDRQQLLRCCTEGVSPRESDAAHDQPAQRDLLGTSYEGKRHSDSESAAHG